MKSLQSRLSRYTIPALDAIQPTWLLVAALLLAAALKAWLILGDFLPFNADEAVVALMARHILQGERPLFFYGQAYMGSLDAWLIAGAFSILRVNVWVIRLVQSLLYLGVLGVVFLLGKEAFGSPKVGGLAAILLAIPTVNVTLYTTVTLGGYGEALLLGCLILWLGMRLGKDLAVGRPGAVWKWLLTGFLAGLAFWGFGLSLVFSLPTAIYLLAGLFQSSLSVGAAQGALPAASSRRMALANFWRFSRLPLSLAILGVLLGAAPYWLFAAQHGFGLLWRELTSGGVADLQNLPWILQVGKNLFTFVLLGGTAIMGLRPPWGVHWLALPLLPFVMFFWALVLIYSLRCLRSSALRSENQAQNSAQLLLVGVTATMILGFVLTDFGIDPSGRYFIPLAIPMALFAASLVDYLRQKYGLRAYALLALVLVYNLWGTAQSAWRNPPGITTQFYAPAQVDQRPMPELIAFLESQDERLGYSNYWVSYPLAFLSQEQLIFVPRLPYHPDFRYTERDDRYPPYGAQVAEAERVAFITTHHLELDERLRTAFQERGVSWKEIRIGDYQVFYGLSKVVRPEEMGLGEDFR
jgi:4-amino-4-deoxy-L-arabinose transferase-like glycosyltransferase